MEGFGEEFAKFQEAPFSADQSFQFASVHRPKYQKVKSISTPALVVDDEDLNVFALQGLLKGENYESDIAYTEQAAIDLFNTRVEKVLRGEADMYQIILLDYSMPGIGGLEVAKIICSLVK